MFEILKNTLTKHNETKAWVTGPFTPSSPKTDMAYYTAQSGAVLYCDDLASLNRTSNSILMT